MRLSRLVMATAFLSAVPAWADIKPHALFGDKMVLQREAPIMVWGTADAGEEVYVHLKIKTKDGSREEGVSTKADSTGNWKAKLSAFPAGIDGVLTIKGAEKRPEPKGKGSLNSVTFKDVLVGEVWVCSGQSNMEQSLSSTPRGGGPETIKNSNNPHIRLFTVPRYAVADPQKGFNPSAAGNPLMAKWNHSTPETTPSFSAVAYHFGRDVQKALNVPVGLIHTSWGGTPAQAWTSREALLAEESLKYYPTRLEDAKKSYDPQKARANYEAALAKWKEAAAKAKEGGMKPPPQPRLANAPGTNSGDPSSLYNGMIEPLLPFTIKGAIWYQGESNAGNPIEYRTLFAQMILDWRKRWGSDLAFYCVQLAPYHAGNVDGENWAYLRDAQTIACARVKNAGVAVITDAGEKDDIHPQAKGPAGARLALLALNKTYGQKVEESGPAFKGAKFEGGKAVVSFDHTAGGLVAAKFTMPGAGEVGADGKLVGFALAGADKVFHPAEATIDGDTVVVTCAKVSNPTAVRYGWKNFPIVNLHNKAGLPTSPFRSDTIEFQAPAKK